jgi:hypothetical protein
MIESGFPEGRAIEPDDGLVYLDRDLFEEPFYEFLAGLGITGYGHPRWSADAFPTENDPKVTVRNAVFCVRPYSDTDEALEENLPNFEHFASGLKVWWYKYVLRSGQANRAITLADLMTIFEACRDSLSAGFDGGRPTPDRVGTITTVRLTATARFLDLRGDDGAVETFFVTGIARMSALLKEGARVGVMIADGRPHPKVVGILDVPTETDG